MPAQATVTAAARMNAIAEQGLCIGCGLCEAVAGAENIRIIKTESGEMQPVISEAGTAVDDALVTKIYDVCPGVRVDGLPAREVTAATHTDQVWGPHLRIVRAWAGDAQVRFEGATGGVLTALAQFILNSGRAEFILHAAASKTEPAFGEARLSFTADQVLHAAGSIYAPATPLTVIADVLAREQPFAFIGKPCDIAALRNFARHDARVDALVKYYLTPVCGGFMPPASIDLFLSRHGIARDEVTALRYRGHGCPGAVTVTTATAVHEFDYLDFWGEDASQWQLPFRCKVCPDGIGEAADIAAADTWHGASPKRGDDDAGVNAVIARTEAGFELLTAAAAAGAITIERDITTQDLTEYQPHQMRKKLTAYDRHLGLKDAGRIVPKTNRLRIKPLAEQCPPAERAQQREGTRMRALDVKQRRSR